MLHQGNRRLYGSNVCEACILFTVVAGIGNGIVSPQFYLLRNDLHFMAQEFFANGFHFPAAFAANQPFFREFQKDFLFRKIVQHFCLTAFLFPLVSLHKNGVRCRFFRFGGLFFFCLVEKTGLSCRT